MHLLKPLPLFALAALICLGCSAGASHQVEHEDTTEAPDDALTADTQELPPSDPQGDPGPNDTVEPDLDAERDATLEETADAEVIDTDEGPELPAWPAPREGCNGHASLCDRPFSEVVMPATHNSMSNRQDGWAGPNQNLNMRQQLIDGVRAFLIDVYDRNGRILLCHGFCGLGSRPLLEAMEEMADFLEAQPNEVIAFLVEDYVSAETLAAVLTEAGLDRFAHTQDPAEPWPTLEEMIAADRRLVVLAQDEGPPPAWIHNLWRHGWDTPFSFDSPEAFNCRANRGSSSNALFLINHWVLDPAARPQSAEIVNTYEALMARVSECRDQWDRLPTFLAVDFYDVGDLFEVVDVLNGVRPAREAE